MFYFVFIIFGLYFLACSSNSLAGFIIILVRNKVQVFISGMWSSLTQSISHGGPVPLLSSPSSGGGHSPARPPSHLLVVS